MLSGTQQGSTLLDDLKEQEDVLNQSVGQLENVEATRSALVSQLKEALQDQVRFFITVPLMFTLLWLCLKFQILMVAF